MIVHVFWSVGFNSILSLHILSKYLKQEFLWLWCKLTLPVQCDKELMEKTKPHNLLSGIGRGKAFPEPPFILPVWVRRSCMQPLTFILVGSVHLRGDSLKKSDVLLAVFVLRQMCISLGLHSHTDCVWQFQFKKLRLCKISPSFTT